MTATNHQPSSPKGSLNCSNDKIRFSFNQLDRKRWNARLVDVTEHLPPKYFYCDTITRTVANQG